MAFLTDFTSAEKLSFIQNIVKTEKVLFIVFHRNVP